MRTWIILAISAVLTLSSQPLIAQTAAISFTSHGTSQISIDSTRGFVFNVTAPVTVSGLSFFDNLGDGLAQAHDVGLWNSAGALLASTTIPSGTAAPLDSSGRFRFVNLPSSVTLSIGTDYRVGGVTLLNTPDLVFANQMGLTSAPGITYVQGAFINNGVAAPTFPTSNLASGFSGGSFVIAPVPEPTGLLAGLVMVTSLALRRKSGRSAARGTSSSPDAEKI